MSGEAYAAPCELCGEPLDVRTDGVYQRVAGWAMNRYKGLHGVALQEREPRWAHRLCIESTVRGTFRQRALPLEGP